MKSIENLRNGDIVEVKHVIKSKNISPEIDYASANEYLSQGKSKSWV